MDRWLLNTFTTWELGLILVAVSAAIACGGNLLGRRFLPGVEERIPATAVGIVIALFSFVLAFLIGELYNSYSGAESNVKSEATALSQFAREASFLGRREGPATSRLALAYASEVEGREWRLLRDGKASPEAWRLVEQMYQGLTRFEPVTESQKAVYAQALTNLDSLVAARRTRLDDAADVSVPGTFEIMLLIGAVLTLLATLDFKPADDRLQLAFVGVTAVFVGMSLLVALSLNHPFSGDYTVSKQPFTEITLAQLDGP